MLRLQDLSHFLDADIFENVNNPKEGIAIACGVIITKINGVYFVRTVGDKTLMMFMPDNVILDAAYLNSVYFHELRYDRTVANAKSLNRFCFEDRLPMSRGETVALGLFMNYNQPEDSWNVDMVGHNNTIWNIPIPALMEAQRQFEEYVTH